ncbi:hypothetical protein GCM10010401_10330 [Rarobacter faecitabidus]|uniref:Two-component system sensor histidine kinase DesK n=1 Tax=Rarobacter faecitabidus TaxID=13243 RepID=A0A542ZPN2_RARFA|nr:sensor histidine kinase [Rarobacter faecitabidus]TQL62226.1 two-component system sensor histidine kinase DesK [Rarobacter faecitabidus]
MNRPPSIPAAAPSGRRRLWRVFGPGLGIVWVVFLTDPLVAAWANPRPVPRALAVGAIVAQALVFAWAVFRQRRGGVHPTGIALLVALQAVLVFLACLGAGQEGLVGLVFVSVILHLILRRPLAFIGTLACVLIAVLLPLFVAGWEFDASLAVSIVLASTAVFAFSQLVRRNRELQQAQAEVADLAVAQERARIARDMHDVLGHSLTVIAVKSELAAKLVPLNPDRATAELLDIQTLARSALADVRGAVAGTRAVTRAGELAAARRALDAAGISAELPGAIDVVRPPLRDLFAWSVREGVTNVVRHSGASHVKVTIAADRLEVADDGRGPTAAAESSDVAAGHGLRGLRERASAAGARVTTTRGERGGFRLIVTAATTPEGS